MAEEGRFLRPNVIIEPLVDRFYAWAHTVAPIQASMNLAFLQVPMLESYLQAPKVHLEASGNPAMRGGYFVNIEEDRVGEVKELLATIKRGRVDMLRFAEAIVAADDLVRREANGVDLTPLYKKLPSELAGLVELAYDTGNQPSIRFIEPLVYKSAAYLEDRQSIQLSLESGTERPFILSTPRLPSPGALDLHLPFRHGGVEELFRSRVRPITQPALREALELNDAEAGQLAGLLTDRNTLSPDRHLDSGGRIRYFGHACLLMQTPEVAVLTDPFISADYNSTGRFTYADLPDHIDMVLITHGHQDHIVLETLLQLRGRVEAIVVPRSSRGSLCDPSLALYMDHLGFPVIEVDDFDEVGIPGGRVTATPFLGEHADLDIRAKSTFLVELGGRSVFVGADSSGIEPRLYRRIRDHLGSPDLAFLGMECDGAPLTWLYQALLTRPVTRKMSNSRKLSGSNADQAARIVTELGVTEVYVYAMGEEDWLGHVMATHYTDDSYQRIQIEQFMTWCRDNSVKCGHLFGQHEWRWS
ncbi:MBL fold metallo-hydrolase [Frankia sp. AgB32]|uniref:MBL fold metallo-hydrolase n=1 Tax=Frankia sp. AgB32 TaxID=631119 RepID=UPI00200BB645|nr:MBL fold metallo-hydrolase [Frankia sp. AgB32]MCK9894101.1 MBL fold metallo-hydrolase [Frankia sp. AgB32]